MTAFTTYADGTPITRAAGYNAAGAPAVTMIVNEFDAARRNLAASDTAAVVPLPAGTFVHKVFVEVLAGDASQTLNVGDATDPDGYVAAGDVGTTGTKLMGGGAYGSGKFYATADTIVIEAPATKAFDTLRIRVVVLAALIG